MMMMMMMMTIVEIRCGYFKKNDKEVTLRKKGIGRSDDDGWEGMTRRGGVVLLAGTK
jgi:hypothetical protein